MHVDAMKRHEARPGRLMLLLGEPSRQAILRALGGGPRCVSDLAGQVVLSQSCTTRHLQALERERIVRGTRAGKRVLYELRRDDALIAELLDLTIGNGVAAARSSGPEASSPEPGVIGPRPPRPGPPAAEPIPGGDRPEAVDDLAGRNASRSDIEDYLL